MQSIIIVLKTICCQLIETSFMVFQECDGFGLAFFLGKRNIMRRDVHVRCCNNDLCNLPLGFPRAQTTSHKPAIRTAATTLPRAQTTSHKPAIHTATTTIRPKPTVVNSHSVGGGGGKKIIVQFQSPISLIYYTKAPKMY